MAYVFKHHSNLSSNQSNDATSNANLSYAIFY